MSISVEAAKELLGIFLADARLTMATLVFMAIVAGVALRVEPLQGGCVLLLGFLAILVEAAVREARRRGAS